ncbi:MAG: RNA polymerase sigma factor [Planctomycetota bacterium JB042]
MTGIGRLNDDLVAAAARGSGDHVDALLERFRPWVTSAVLGHLFAGRRRLETVADLTQEALAAVARGLPKLNDPTESGLRRYTSAVIRNLVLGHADRESRRPAAIAAADRRRDGVTADRCLDALLATTGAGPATEVERRERIEALRGRMATLSETSREILRLVIFEQRTTTEAARELGIERSTAGMRFKRAMEQLRGSGGATMEA